MQGLSKDVLGVDTYSSTQRAQKLVSGHTYCRLRRGSCAPRPQLVAMREPIIQKAYTKANSVLVTALHVSDIHALQECSNKVRTDLGR